MLSQDLLTQHVSRDITALYKNCLVLIENIKAAHTIMIDRLKRALPKEAGALVDCADFLDEPCLKLIRKRILDLGNETIRSVTKELENFEIQYKNQ